MKDIFTCFLKSLGVKHTVLYSLKLYNEHPDRNNMFGLSDMLGKYGIENTGLRLDDKNDIDKIFMPFFAHIHNDFVVVERIEGQNVHYVWHQKRLVVDRERFNTMWSGAVLVAEAGEHSAEPNYHQNRKEEWVRKGQKGLLVGLAACAVVGGLAWRGQTDRLWVILSFLLSAAGLGVGTLLVLQQAKLDNGYADRICSAFTKGDCEKIIGSPEAKLFSVFQWSDMGVGYFVGNLILLSFFPYLSSYVVWVNILTLPFTFWSVWFQGLKTKQWCVLCLTVLLLLWLLFGVSLLFGELIAPVFEWRSLWVVALAYALPFLGISILMPVISKAKKHAESEYQINRVKMREEVFGALLCKQRRFEMGGVSSVVFGPSNAKHTVTVVTNPHCGPCARMHRRLEQLIENPKNHLAVRYIFSSFGPDLDRSGIGLLWIYRMLPCIESRAAYNEWFEVGKEDPDAFFRRYRVVFSHSEVLKEYAAHQEWVTNNAIAGTPTVIYDGYELGDIYTVGDLPCFDELVVDAK